MTDLILDPVPGITPNDGSEIRTDMHNEISTRLGLTRPTAHKVIVTDASGFYIVGGASDTELSYLSGVTSSIQAQLNGKQPSGAYLTSPINESDVTNLGTDLASKLGRGASATTQLPILESDVTNLVSDLANKASFPILENQVTDVPLTVSHNNTSGFAQIAPVTLYARLMTDTNIQPFAQCDSVAVKSESTLNSGQVQIGVYQDNGSNYPGALLGKSNAVTVTGNAYVELPLISAVTVPTDGKLWIVIFAAGSQPDYPVLYRDFNAGGFTDTFVIGGQSSIVNPYPGGATNDQNRWEVRLHMIPNVESDLYQKLGRGTSSTSALPIAESDVSGLVADLASKIASGALLDPTRNTDTVAQSPSRGSIIYGNSTPAWDELVVGPAGNNIYTDGTDAKWSDLPQTNKTPSTNETMVDNFSSYVSGSYEIPSANVLELPANAVMEIG